MDAGEMHDLRNVQYLTIRFNLLLPESDLQIIAAQGDLRGVLLTTRRHFIPTGPLPRARLSTV
jgi:hypothetical protein